ncbi:MAG: hypothetical protein IJC15_04185, partial [Clostridia bacterium]|nr:hypothetical protein [Clostridia bacterium]
MKHTVFQLLLLTLLLVLPACQSGGAAETTAPPAETTAPETEAAALAIVENGTVNYAVVRHEGADTATVDAAVLVRELIGQKTGVFPSLSTDWHKKGTSLNADTPEILVGATDYPESAAALEGIPYGDYIVTRVGSKLVINAWCPAGLREAVDALGRELLRHAEEGSFSLPADVRLTGTAVETINQLPLYS